MESNFIPIKNNLLDRNLIDSKLDELNKWKSASKVLQKSSQNKKEIAKAARGFESIFVNMMIKGLKETLLNDDEDNSENMMFGANTLQSYGDMLWADDISKTGKGIGLAEMIYKQLTGGDNLEPIRTIFAKSNIIENKKEIAQINKESVINPIENKIDKISIKYKKDIDSNDKIIGSSFRDRVNRRLRKYQDSIFAAAEKYNIPQPLIKAVITAESAGIPTAKSKAGAKGLMQLMDGTAKNLGVKNSYDPYENIMGGTLYLKMMLEQFDNNLDYALAAYNAGPGNVQKYNGVPPFNETKAYLQRVKKYFDLFNKEIKKEF